MNDLRIEPFLALTITEQLSLIVGIKLLFMSELMLSFACFRCLINFIKAIGLEEFELKLFYIGKHIESCNLINTIPTEKGGTIAYR